jgi:hypothetical protein
LLGRIARFARLDVRWALWPGAAGRSRPPPAWVGHRQLLLVQQPPQRGAAIGASAVLDKNAAWMARLTDYDHQAAADAHTTPRAAFTSPP